MAIWQQHLMRRLHQPAGDEGSDTGGPSATELAMDAIGQGPAGPAASEPPEPRHPEVDAIEATPEAQAPAARDPQSRVSQLLDALSGDPAPEVKPEVPPEVKTEPVAADQGAAATKTEADEAELLEGVKSERGKERVRQVFTENKSLKSEINEFQSLVKSTGMTAEQFAQTLEFGRLMTSSKPENLRVAVQLLEQQRTQLYAALGQEAPGVDLLADFADLKESVENMDMTRERAVEMAKYRRIERDKQAQAQASQAIVERQGEYQQKVSNATTQMDAYLQTRASEADHQARISLLGARFKDEVFMKQFLDTEPAQWVTMLRVLYDGVQPAPVARAVSEPQPIRARSRSLGNPLPSGSTPMDRLAQRMENMGI